MTDAVTELEAPIEQADWPAQTVTSRRPGTSAAERKRQQVTPADTTVGRLCAELGFAIADNRHARSLDKSAAAELLQQLRRLAEPIQPKALGAIGPNLFGNGMPYACHMAFARQAGLEVPYVVEVWAHCERPERRGDGSVHVSRLLINRTPSVAQFYASSGSKGVTVRGCGIHRTVAGPKTGDYNVSISIITPYVELATDGKEPALAPFSEGIAAALRRACIAAWRRMDKPQGSISIKEAARRVMSGAYRIASANGTLPANARQVMYAARGTILRLTGKDQLNDHYFTQTLLPDFLEEHPEETANWAIQEFCHA